MECKKPSRRDFLETVVGASATLLSAPSILAGQRSEAGLIPTRPLGSTGERVSILCLGGWHIGAVERPEEAVRIMHRAVDSGMTFFDNAWDYHNGGSEEIMGRALAAEGYRNRVFLMTKNCERDYAGSLRNLEDSLRRLRTNHIDLWQFHEMVYDNDPDWVIEKGGLKAALEAQKQGKVRFIGFTGHKDPRIHLKMLDKDHAWDTAQMPINVLDAHYRSFQKAVVPVCLEKGTAVIGMKSLGGGYPRGIIAANSDLGPSALIRYSLSQPISSLVVGIHNMKDLEQDLEIARNFRPMPDPEQEDLRRHTAEIAGDGRLERFKSTQAFDGPHHRRQHGFAT